MISPVRLDYWLSAIDSRQFVGKDGRTVTDKAEMKRDAAHCVNKCPYVFNGCPYVSKHKAFCEKRKALCFGESACFSRMVCIAFIYSGLDSNRYDRSSKRRT